MKTESTVKYVLRLAATLFLITAVVAALLAGVNSVTEPIITAANEAKTQAAIELVLPGGGEAIEVPEGTRTDCVNYGSISGTDYVGGAFGLINKATSDCYSYGTVTSGGKNVGDVVGGGESYLVYEE